MVAEAQKNGLVAVSVHLAPVSLDDMHSDLKGAQKMVAKKAAKLLADLGDTVAEGGRWDNTVGQIGFHVTKDGLLILQNSNNAISFSKDARWYERSSLDKSDGSLAGIEAQLAQNGYADVVITLNYDDLEHTTQKDGSITYHSSQGNNDDVNQKAKGLQAKLAAIARAKTPSASLGKIAALLKYPDTAAAFDPRITMRLTREEVLAVADDDNVRKMVPVGFTDVRPTMLDPDALVSAERDGTAKVLITVRNPLFGGKTTVNSFAAMKHSNKRALDNVLADAGIKSAMADLSNFGVVSGHITHQELQALYAAKDSRILAVELNKPVAKSTLSNSAKVLMNMEMAWGKNIRGAGQTIVILDSGIQKDHPFFLDANGKSRVVYEGCYGTTEAVSMNANFGLIFDRSQCPNADASTNYDSPIGWVGSASPLSNHGTLVAGKSYLKSYFP